MIGSLFNSDQGASFIRSFLKLVGMYFALKGADAGAVDQIVGGLTTIIIGLGQSHLAHKEEVKKDSNSVLNCLSSTI